MLATAFVALENAADQVKTNLPFAKKRKVRAYVRSNRRDILRDAFEMFRDKVAEETPEVEPEDGSDRPILDFWKWLIESGKIQAFMKFLVEEFLPKLFALILQIIDALS